MTRTPDDTSAINTAPRDHVLVRPPAARLPLLLWLPLSLCPSASLCPHLSPPQLYDFVDTVFMVLRGKWGQFSFLHTYHHVSIFLTYWWVTNTAHTGDTWFPVLLNSLVHAVMYFYYLLSEFGLSSRC